MRTFADHTVDRERPSSVTTSDLAPHASVLVVDPLLEDLLLNTRRLTDAGFRVTVAETFAQAKPVLISQPPAVLLTAIRLEAYNGLHLVHRGKALRPSMAALVTCPVLDVVLQADAEAIGATFLLTPITERELLGAVLQTLFRRDPAGAPIRPPFERRLRERRATGATYSDERRASDRRRRLPWVAHDAGARTGAMLAEGAERANSLDPSGRAAGLG